MIKDDYCNFETAKLLKEKGFDVFGDGSFDSGIEIYKEYNPLNGSLTSCATSKPHPKGIPTPTLQMAMKWLREVHQIFIRVIQSHIEYCACEIYYNRVSHYEFRESFNSYEEAAETAIKYCLEKLI